MNQRYRPWLCAGLLAIWTSSVSAHTAKVCWRTESDGSVTMFAGDYHGQPGLFGGILIDEVQYDFTDWTPTLPSDVTACQADCAPYPPLLKWQIVNVTLPPGLHLLTTTSTSEHETPWPGCFPTAFGTGAPIPTALYYTGGTSSDQGVAVTVGAILWPVVQGALVVFTLDGGESCPAYVDVQGIASCAITPQRPGGVYPLTASYLGDGTIEASSKTISFTVRGEPPPPPPPPPAAPTTLAYAGDTYVANARPAQLSGVLRGEDLAPIAGRTVHFTLGAGPAAQSCSGDTDASGTASCSIGAVDQPLDAAAAVAISASFAGDASYLPSSADAEAPLLHMTGEAYAIAGHARVWFSSITVPRTPDTGPARAAHASATTTPCAAKVSAKKHGLEVLAAHQLCANVTTNLTLGTSTATASIDRVTIPSAGLLPALHLNAIEAHAQASCDGASGQATIGSLSIGNLTIPIGTMAPNTTLALPFGGRITFNEQLPAAEGDHGLTVRGVHIVIPSVHGFGGLDFELASATSAIHGCPPTSLNPILAFAPRGAGPADAANANAPDAAADPDAAELGDADADAEGADAADPEGGCQSTRPGGAIWLAAIALLFARRRRRDRARARAVHRAAELRQT